MSSGAVAVTSPVPRAAWEAALRADPGAVVSQSLAWRDAVFSSGRLEDVSVLYQFSSGRQVVLPLARRRGGPRQTASLGSWPRVWGVGGPICPAGQVTPDEAVAVLADVAGRGAPAAQITLRHDADPTWVSQAHQFGVQERGSYVLDLDGGFAHVWARKFRGNFRAAVRKAERSDVDVEVDRSGKLLGVFYDLYQESLRRKAAELHEPLWLTRLWMSRVSPTSRRQLTTVARCFGEDCAVWVARSQGQPVAALIALRAGRYAKGWRVAVLKEAATPVRASELLHRLDIEEACRDGYQFYDLGGAAPGSPVASYKTKLGAAEHFTHELRAERPSAYAARRGTQILAWGAECLLTKPSEPGRQGRA
jgi:hypothetical protein